MDKFTSFETQNAKQATHSISVQHALKHYCFPVNAKLYHESEGQEKQQQEDCQESLQLFIDHCTSKNFRLFESFNLKFVPIYIQLLYNDPEESIVKKFVKLLQNTIRNMYECNSSGLLTVVSKDEGKTHILVPSSRVELSDVKTIREKMVYLCENSKEGKVFEESAKIISSSIYERSVHIPSKNAVAYPYLEEKDECWLIDSLKIKFTPAQFLSFSYVILEPWKHTKEYTKLLKKSNKDKAKKSLLKEVKIKSDVEKLEELKELINTKRCATYVEWKQMGQCIFNVYEGEEDGIDTWKYLSRDCDFEDECEEAWEKMEMKDRPTIATIIHFAKIDNPDGYFKWLNENMYERLKYCLFPEAGMTDFAQLLFDLYSSKFICACYNDDTWYEFVGHYWKKMDGPLSISKLISTQHNNFSLVNLFKQLKKSLEEQFKNAPDDEKEAAEELVKKCSKVISNLKSPGFKASIIKEAKELFYNSEFMEKMNSNENLLVFENGVIDFTQTVESKKEYVAPTFRPGKPEDMITISTKYDYIEYKWDDPLVQFVLHHFKKIFTNTNVRKYFWRFCSSILVGKNKDKVLPFFTGPKGNNGKSVTMEMLEKVMGDFCKKVNYSFLTQERKDSSATTNDLVMVRYSRLIICNEADANKKLQCSVVKELTGNDSMQIRDLFKQAENFVPHFKIIVIANNPPPYDSKEDAMKNRIKIVEFNSHFVFRSENPDMIPKSESEQYKQRIFEADKDFSSKIKQIIQPFMWLLVQHFKYYQMEGLNEPVEVAASTNEYNKSNNHIMQFCDETIESVSGHQVKLDQLYDQYKVWYPANFTDKNMLTKLNLKAMLVKLGYVITLKNEVTNVKLKPM